MKLLPIFLMGILALPVWACEAHLDGHAGHEAHAGHDSAHDGHGTPALAPEMADNPAVQAYVSGMDKMHADMAIDYTGDADIDFLKGMIPHHQGAIDMAQVVMMYGRDPQVRRLAQDVIRAQEVEIRFMRAYLKGLEERGVRPVKADAVPRAGFSDAGWLGSTWMGER